MKVCNRSALSRLEQVADFDGWIVSEPFQQEFHEKICLGYPSKGWERLHDDAYDQGRGGDISGHLELRSGAPDCGDDAVEERFWRTLYSELTADEYDSILGSQLPVDLLSTRKEIRLVRYGPGSYLGPHFDNQRNKVLTQVLWPNLEWFDAWGGHLELLEKRPNGSLRVLRAIPPLIAWSVITLSTPRALHRVSAVKSCATSIRQTIIVEWYRA